MESENQERREREIWRSRESEKDMGAFFLFLSIRAVGGYIAGWPKLGKTECLSDEKCGCNEQIWPSGYNNFFCPDEIRC